MKHADCSLPIDNESLFRIVEKVEEKVSKGSGGNK